MPNLVGIGNSQVPTNAMLGGLAYQDSVGEIDLEKIKARTGDTATDVFVYDTRKDSDGGAWRHRTQKTSWYNEGVSATRGARKEFPAVAVIVAEQNFITIYDGDDPNLSMWMVFNTIAGGNSQGMADRPMVQLQGVDKVVYMLNGILATGTKNEGSNYGQPIINFINERVLRMDSQGGEGGEWMGNIAQRNDAIGYRHVTYDYVIAASQVNDVAMTVLPNAPIDESTGLPIPTIAVATPSGTNVINDNGTVTQGYQTIATEHVDLHPDGFMTDGISGATNDSFSLYDITQKERLYSYGHRVNTHSIVTYLNEGTGECLFEGSGNKIAIAQSHGLLRIVEIIEVEKANDAISFGLHNRTTSSYNTGWMPAENKGTFLSDTDTTDITGSELIGNPGPFSNTTGWVADNGFTISESGNRLRIDSNGNSGSYFGAYYTFTTVVGKKYVLSVDIHSQNANSVIRLSGSGTYFTETAISTTGMKVFYFTSDQASTTVRIGSDVGQGSSRIQEIRNVNVREIEEDRSSHAKGLQIFGTIEKHAVATGAELVSYRPNASSQGDNYFHRPLTSTEFDLTTDWSISFWARNNNPGVANDYSGFEISPNDVSGNSAYSLIPISMYVASNGLIGLRGAGFTGLDATYNPLSVQDVWRCFNIVHRGGRVYLYIDAKRDGDKDATFANPSTAYALTIFKWTYSSTRYSGRRHIDFSLFKLSEIAPSEDQIKKMYDDEKHLFKENAKCTFYGTSNAVVSLAHDDTSNILHVGTSAGRSEFRGLNRINNTTTAVTTAISASNGLVAEQ